MPPERKPTIDEILKKHAARIEQRIKTSAADIEKVNYSQSYSQFKEEMSPDLSRFEKWCKTLGNIVKLKVSKKDDEKIRKYLEIAHLDLEPSQTITLSVMVFISVFLLGLFISVAISLFQGGFENFPAFFFILVFIFAMFLFYFVNGYPARLANKWRLKASSQMVPAILYIVVYMRHTPNLEKAIAFASQHLQYPLALDFKKVFYNVELGKFSTIKESLDNYLAGWRDYSVEFIEAFHLIESSLFEPEEGKRIVTLEKALQTVLDGVYDKMLKFTHEVRSPLTNVYMLGVVLPTLALALLPLASAMIGDALKWYHVMILFNLIIPFFVFYLTDKIMFLRPGGYGESSLLERNPLYPAYKSRKPYFSAFLICLPFFIIGLLPLVFQTSFPSMIGLKQDYTFSELGIPLFGSESIFGFRDVGGKLTGPFGVGALIMGVFFTFGVALFFSMAFKEKTKGLIKEREKTKQLEVEFNNSLFQLGNRIGNGVPPELAFSKVAESTKGLKTEDFFKRVNYNIMQMGMSVEGAIFDPKRGAIAYYPSDLIATSMKILVESAKKGLNIAAISLVNISEYVKNINKITDRLKDMLAEIISDMKSNMTFLAPLLSGIVIGLAAMITSILSKLSIAQAAGSTETVAGFGNLGTILSLFDMTKMIPPYMLQIIVGVYIIEIIFILTGALVVIDSGEDKLEKTNKTGINLRSGVGLYVITALIAIISLFFLTALVLGNLT
jgi:Flp pilus assembly protein TadB